VSGTRIAVTAGLIMCSAGLACWAAAAPERQTAEGNEIGRADTAVVLTGEASGAQDVVPDSTGRSGVEPVSPAEAGAGHIAAAKDTLAGAPDAAGAAVLEEHSPEGGPAAGGSRVEVEEDPYRQRLSFRIRRIKRPRGSEKSLAESPPRSVGRGAVAPRKRSSPYGWDHVALDFSGLATANTGPGASGRYADSRVGVELSRTDGTYRSTFGTSLGTINSKRYLAELKAGLVAGSGWKVRIGDDKAPALRLGLAWTRFRGITISKSSLEREPRGDLPVSATTFFTGKCPVSYQNIEKGIFPRTVGGFSHRRVLGGYGDLRVQAVTYGDSPGSLPDSVGIRQAFVEEAAASFRSKDRSLEVSLARNSLTRRDGLRQRDLAAHLSGRIKLDDLALSSELEKSRGEFNQLGSLGALQTRPIYSFRLGATYRPIKGIVFGADRGAWASGSERQVQLSERHHSWQASWRSSRTRTSLGISRRIRERVGRSGRSQVHSTILNLGQEVKGVLKANLGWNRQTTSRSGSSSHYDFVTGSVGLKLPHGAGFSMQQRYQYQRLSEARLQTIGYLSSPPLLKGRLSLALQVGLTQTEMESGGFKLDQTDAKLFAGLRLRSGSSISVVYQSSTTRYSSSRSWSVKLGKTFRSSRPGPLGVSGVLVPVAIHEVKGYVFYDKDGDGIQGEGEPGVQGVEISIDGDLGEVAVTDAEGFYRCFCRAGEHYLEVLPRSVPVEFSLVRWRPRRVEVKADQALRLDFPLVQMKGLIQGVVREEGSLEGIPGITIYLNDRDFLYTDKNGVFRFEKLPPGEYKVRLDKETLPFGYRLKGEGETVVRLGEGTSERTGIEFTSYRPVRSIKF